jgi:hypothetical protein
VTRQVEHVNGVVTYGVYKKPKFAFLLSLSQERITLISAVTCDLRESNELAVVVFDRIDDHMCPERRSVLSQAPSLRLEAPSRARGLQIALGLTGGLLFVGIEPREMLTDNLLRRITLGSLCSWIPVSDETFGC